MKTYFAQAWLTNADRTYSIPLEGAEAGYETITWEKPWLTPTQAQALGSPIRLSAIVDLSEEGLVQRLYDHVVLETPTSAIAIYPSGEATYYKIHPVRPVRG